MATLKKYFFSIPKNVQFFLFCQEYKLLETEDFSRSLTNWNGISKWFWPHCAQLMELLSRDACSFFLKSATSVSHRNNIKVKRKLLAKVIKPWNKKNIIKKKKWIKKQSYTYISSPKLHMVHAKKDYLVMFCFCHSFFFITKPWAKHCRIKKISPPAKKNMHMIV